MLADPTLVIFFENEKILISKKITTMGSKHHLNPIVVFFLKSKFFHFQKKSQVLADPVVVNFFGNALDPTLVIFLEMKQNFI